MKKYLLIAVIIILSISYLQSQPGNFYMDNGQLQGYYVNEQLNSWEATSLLQPPGPGIIDTVWVYLGGSSTASVDTIRVVGDPADGSYPPTMYVHHINTYATFIVNYTGTAGWYPLDVREFNIRTGGVNRVAVQHNMNPGGPRFGVSTKSQTQSEMTSFINDVYRPNPNFYNIRGTLASAVGAHYMVRLSIRYDYPEGTGSALPPEPTLIDITEQAGLPLIKNALTSVADWNNDGFDDIAIGSRFFQNNTDGTFTEVTDKFGITASGTVWADIDGDGYIDCFALRGGGNDRIYYGQPDGTFVEDTDEVFKINAPTVTPMIFDYNNDGLLDIFIAYGRTSGAGGAETYYPDKLYRNDGNRKFTDVTHSSNISLYEPAPYYDCWGASLVDYNNDGNIDVFVATYRLAPDLLLRNNGDGTFTDVGAETGARGVPTFAENYFGHGMGSDWGDYDNDGMIDLAVGNLAHWDERGLWSNKSLILKNEITQFVDKTGELNLQFFEMNGGILWVDLNNDLYLDVVHAQYAYHGRDDGPDKFSRIYLNQGPDEDYKLKDVTWETGAIVHGAWSPVRLDINNNGSMDLLMASSNEYVKLYRNDIPNKGNFISFRLSVDKSVEDINKMAYGTKVELYAGGERYLRQLPGSVMTARGSQNTNLIHFGLGSINVVDSVVFTYSNGIRTKITQPQINKVHSYNYPAGLSVNDEIDYHFSIDKIAPNPASNNTIITLNIDKPDEFRIVAFDTKGSRVAEIFSDLLVEGQHNIQWNLEDLPSGVYIINVLSSGITLTSKVVKID